MPKDKLFAHVVRQRHMPVDFTVDEMRAIPGAGMTSIKEHEDFIMEISYRLEHPEQLEVFQELLIKAIRREHGSIKKVTFLTREEASRLRPTPKAKSQKP